MERCGFFDAELVGEEYDRSYLAEQFAAYFASFIGNGVFGGRSDELQIVAMNEPSMQVTASSGQAWINGYWYENTDDLYLPIDVADGVLDRIDSIVVCLGFAERNMWLAVKKGTPSNSPKAPELIRNSDYYELQIATIRIKAGSLNVKQADITDTRLDTSVCGFVVSLVEQLDTATFSAQLNAWIEQFKLESNDEVNFLVEQLNTWLGSFKTQSIEEVNALVEQLRTIVDAGDIGPLINDVQSLKDNKVNKAGDIMSGNLTIAKQTAPTLILTEQSTGASLHIQFLNDQLFIASRPAADDDSNYRAFFISNHKDQDNVVNAIGLADVRDGAANLYTVIHAGNLPVFGIGVVPASIE